jgi:hypothetical protein
MISNNYVQEETTTSFWYGIHTQQSQFSNLTIILLPLKQWLGLLINTVFWLQVEEQPTEQSDLEIH